MAVGTLKTSTPSILSLDEIKRRLTPIFKKYQVRRAYLFGSYQDRRSTPCFSYGDIRRWAVLARCQRCPR